MKLKRLNLSKVKIDGMLLATFLTTLFYSSTYPYIHQTLMSGISSNLLAISNIINCVSVIIFGFLWNKYRSLFKYYPIFCIIETFLSISSGAFVIITNNMAAYYMIDTLIFAIITRNVCCGGIRLRALRYENEEKRSEFDNNNNSASAIATIIGSLIAITLKLDFSVMIALATFGNVIDNLFYINIYHKTKKVNANLH